MVKINKKILVSLLIIAIIVSMTGCLKDGKSVTKESVTQRFSEFENRYQNISSEGYNVTTSETWANKAKTSYNKKDYKLANDYLDNAFKALDEATITATKADAISATNYTTSISDIEDILPPNLSPLYKQGYIDDYEWLDKEITDLKPTQYKPMMFTGFHLPISYELFPYTNSTEDIKFLDVLTELDVDVVGVGVRAPESHTKDQLERLDTLFNEVRKRNIKLKIWYFGGAYNSKTDYIDKGYNATKDIIERWHPDYYTIVHEPTTQEHAYNFDMSQEEWQEYIKNSCDIAKRIYPNVKTAVTVVNSATDINYIDYFVKIPNLDMVGFDIYHTWGLCGDCNGGNSVEQKIRLIQSHGKKVWIEETWLSTQWKRPKTNPPGRFEGFDYPSRAQWDSKWMWFIVEYAQQHNIEAVEPFFTNYFILYPGYDPYANEQKYVEDYRTALYEGKRTPTFYAFRDVIKEVKGTQQ